MLCTMLTHAGLSCHGAADGPAGLQLIEEIAPAIVILDVGLPGLDGLEVARRIRENPRHRGVRLIALTGYGQTRDRAATAAAGFDYHLVKPVQPGELLGLIARLQMSFASSSGDAGAVSPSGA
jgi:two-component system CheB/CheR fusion protein